MVNIKEILKQSDNVLGKKKISKDECIDLENNCYICLSNINKKIQTCINMFNTLVQDLAALLSREFPQDVILKTYHGVISNIISSNPLEPISSFIMNVYSNDTYRKYILKGDDNFFMNNSYGISSEKDKIQMLFQFKSCWKNLKDGNRDYIKNAMKMLVDITGQYIVEKDDGYKLADIIKKTKQTSLNMNN
jgi:hypothetical protein